MAHYQNQIAIFAAGCFWGVESSFRTVPGVINVEAGYTSGTKENPTYKEVCTGKTGHAEAVRVQFDSAQIGYEELVKFFFEMHDPTTLNRQGPDAGTQYRSGIYYADEGQRVTAEKVKQDLEGQRTFNNPIVTEIKAATPFYRAEEYHQRYFEKNSNAYCHFTPYHK